MSVAFGRAAWPINALLFVLMQSPRAWLAFRLENLATALAAAYYGQRRQLWAALLLRYIGSAVMLTFWLSQSWRGRPAPTIGGQRPKLWRRLRGC